MKRLLAMSLAVIMLLMALVSCNSAETPTAGATDAPATETTADGKKDDASNKEEADKGETAEKTVPVYQGMSVVNTISQAKTLMSNSVTLLSGGINQKDPFGKGNRGPHIEDKIKDEFNDKTGGVTVDGDTFKETYYSQKNNDVFILIHINNPDQYEILSFTLNGQKYANNMFEDGSNLQTLILKVSIGDVSADQIYTIDAIKYVDGTEIKDVKMEGNKTVKINIVPSVLPTATVTLEEVYATSMKINATVTDEHGFIKKSGGKIYIVVFDGEEIVKCVEYESGKASTVEGLENWTLYQYAIVALYDPFDGSGMGAHVMYKKAFKTRYVGGSIGSTDWVSMDFGGEDINILVREDLKASREWEVEIIDYDDELELAIEARNEVVESDLNVNVHMVYVTGPNSWVGGGDYDSTFMPLVQQDIVNDLHEIDIAANFGYKPMNAAYRDCWANLLDKDTFPYFNFSLPCWNQSLVENGTVNDQLYLCAGDMNLSMIDTAMIMWHNKDLYNEVKKPEDPDDIQDLAIAGEWYYSELYKWSQYYNDMEPTGNKGDIYGIKMQGCIWPTQPMQALPYAWDIHFMTQNRDGTWEYNLIGNNRAEEGLKAIRNLFLQKGVANELTGSGNFPSGTILFQGDIIYWSKDSNLAIREMEDKYTLLPWPMFDDNQDHYATTSQDYLTMVTILDHSRSTVPIQGDVVSAYLQYSNEYSYTNVRGYYFERIIKPKFFGTDDSDGHVTKSIKIFNIIITNLEYDFATIYSPMLGGVVGSCWVYNIVDSTGQPYKTSVEDKYTSNKIKFDEELELLEDWFALAEY